MTDKIECDENNLIEDMRSVSFSWYGFTQGASIRLVKASNSNENIAWCDSVRKNLTANGYSVQIISTEDLSVVVCKCDYVILMCAVETSPEPLELIMDVKHILKSDGHLLIAVRNRMGLRYMCGDRDHYTGRCFDGIYDYRNVSESDRKYVSGRTFSYDELHSMVSYAGYAHPCFFSVFPDIVYSQLIYRYDTLPNENLMTRYMPYYDYPGSVFLEERNVIDTVAMNGCFHAMANAYIIECSADSTHSDVTMATLSADRGHEDSAATIIHDNKIVEKKALFEDGRKKCEMILSHDMDLRDHGIVVVPSRIENGDYVTDFIDAQDGVSYFRDLFEKDEALFYKQLDHYMDLINKSSDHSDKMCRRIENLRIKDNVDTDDIGVILSNGYWDMVPLNSFMINGEFEFFDQEFMEHDIPAKAVILRTLIIIYGGSKKLQKKVAIDTLFERYGLFKNRFFWEELASGFINKLRNVEKLISFHNEHDVNFEKINTKRQMINFSDEDYEKIFIDIFRDTDDKKLIVFGAGKYAEHFMTRYASLHKVDIVVDNNRGDKGEKLGGIEVCDPNILKSMDPENYKVIICIKQYSGAVMQLHQLGCRYYSIFDVSAELPPERLRPTCNDTAGETHKKYHIGYVAGVFDLFHVGHLNLLKRAKEQCDYLIVGVVSDQGVEKRKKTDPYIPFSERIEIVRACRYVDQAVEIPFVEASTIDAYRRYKFDAQFSGSDYADDSQWLATKKYLEAHGSELVFFPYTQSTSSTKIKASIDKEIQSD